MPDGQEQNSQNNRRKLEHTKVDLDSAESPSQSLGRLRQTEAGSKVNKQSCCTEGENKGSEPARPDLLPRAGNEDARQDDEETDRKDLVC